MTRRTHRVSVNLDHAEVAKLAKITPAGASLASTFRTLLRAAAPAPAASHAEAVMLLSESARRGSTQAIIALERATRPARGEADLDDALRRLLGDQ